MFSALASSISRSWSARGPLACALWPLSLLFRFLTAVRRGLFYLRILRSERLPVPVIIVGNIFVGGTGKTPFTIWLIEELRRAGFTPGVISRGYGAKDTAPRLVSAASAPLEAGDEPVLIAARTNVPVMVGRDRPAAGRALLALRPDVDVLVSDDGLQHYALDRDIEVVVSDARGNGNGWLLPAGPLREPASRRRDFTVMNSAPGAPGELGAYKMELAGDFAERLQDRSVRLSLTSLPKQRILAAAGIGNPRRFFALLKNAGLVFEEMPLPDHFDFRVNPFAASSAEIILLTEKDAVKCRQLEATRDDARIWVVPVDARLDPSLAEHLVEKLRGYPTA